MLRFVFVYCITDDSSDTDLGDDEIENMLDEGLPDDIRNKKVETQYDEKYKTVLEGSCVNR